MQDGAPIESAGSYEPGLNSTCEPGDHKWMSVTITQGHIFGEDSLGHPVFVPSPVCDSQTAFGCAICDEPWTASLTGYAS
jgi:hypothetical protein